MSNEFKCRSIGTSLTAGVSNTVYTCPSKYIAKVILLFFTNHGSGNKTITVRWSDASTGTTYVLLGGYTLSSYAYLKIDGSYIVLNPGDTISVTPEAGSTIDSVITVEEQYSVSEI